MRYFVTVNYEVEAPDDSRSEQEETDLLSKIEDDAQNAISGYAEFQPLDTPEVNVEPDV